MVQLWKMYLKSFFKLGLKHCIILAKLTSQSSIQSSLKSKRSENVTVFYLYRMASWLLHVDPSRSQRMRATWKTWTYQLTSRTFLPGSTGTASFLPISLSLEWTSTAWSWTLLLSPSWTFLLWRDLKLWVLFFTIAVETAEVIFTNYYFLIIFNFFSGTERADPGWSWGLHCSLWS